MNYNDYNDTMVVDMYELPMAQTYFDTGDKDTYVYFDIFFRRNPFKGGYTVSGGLDNIIKYIQNFKYSFHFFQPHCSAIAFAIPGKVLLRAFALSFFGRLKVSICQGE